MTCNNSTIIGNVFDDFAVKSTVKRRCIYLKEYIYHHRQYYAQKSNVLIIKIEHLKTILYKYSDITKKYIILWKALKLDGHNFQLKTV